jgi:hypothetical protein
LNVVEFGTGGHREDGRPLDADRVHGVDPVVDFFRGLGVRVRVHVDDGEFRLGDVGDRDFVNRLRAVVFEEDVFGGGLGAGEGGVGLFREGEGKALQDRPTVRPVGSIMGAAK